MVEKADSQQYVEVCTLLLCGWSNYYTACCLVWWLQMVSFSAPYLRVLRVFLFEVCVLCFIVTFHVTTFDKLQIKHISFVLPTGSTNAYLPVHSVLNLRFLESTCRFLSGLKHGMIFICWEKDTVHKSICPRCCHWHTQPAWPTELAANIEWVSCYSDVVITAPDWTSGLDTEDRNHIE